MRLRDSSRDLRALLLALFLLGLALGPRLALDQVEARSLGVAVWPWRAPFGVLLNLDAFLYMDAARQPQSLTAPGAALQARPLVPWLLYPLVRTLERVGLGAGAADLAREPADAGILAPYFAWLLFNLAVLASAIVLATHWLQRIPGADSGLAVAGSMVLAFNPLGKAFLLQPHLQLLHLLVPMVAILAWQQLWHASMPKRARYWLYSAAVGLGMLAYAGFAVVAVVIALAVWRHRRAVAGPAYVGALGMLALLVLPTLVWVAVLAQSGTGYQNYEIERWRQVVWIGDLLRASGIWATARQLSGNLGFLALESLRFAAPALCMAVVAVAASRPYWAELRRDRGLHLALGACLAVALLSIGFYAAVGLRVSRLASAAGVCIALAAMGVALAALSRHPQSSRLHAWAWSAMTGLGACWVAADGPYV